MAAVIRILVQVDGNLDAVKKDVDDVGSRAKSAGSGFTALQEIAVGALRQIGAAAINLAGAAIQKLGGFLVDSIGVAGNFEGKMNEVGAALGKGFEPGTEGLNEFKDLFISLGKELPVSTAEVQDAALALVKGGLDPAVIQAGALKDSLNFAAAAGMGLADAAELTIKQLGTFVPLGASVEEQTRFMADAQNLMVKAAGASTLDVDKLGDAMLASAGAAKASGVEYQDFVTTMGLISPSFGSAAEAGTSYRNFLARLIPTTKGATSLMVELGLATKDGSTKFYDANGAFIGNAAAAQLLQDKMKGLTDEQRAEAMQTIFGNDAKGAAIALMDAGAEGYDLFAQKMADANGVGAQATAVQQGFNFQMENAKGSLEALQITIGTMFMPILADLIANYITPGINKVMGYAEAFMPVIESVKEAGFMSSEFAESLGYFATQLGLPGEVIQDITAALQGLIATIQETGFMSSEFGESLGYLATQLGLPGEMIQDFTFAMQDFVTFVNANLVPILSALAAMLIAAVVPAFVAWATAAGTAALVTITALAPILIPIAAIGAAVALLTAAWQNNFGDIQGKTAAAWAMIQPVFDQIVAWLQVNIPLAIQAAADYWTNTLWPALEKVWAFIQTQVIPILIQLFNDTFAALNSAVQTVSDYWTGTLEPALRAVWQFIQTYVIPIVNTLTTVYIAFLQVEIAALAALWRAVLLPAITAIWQFINDKIIPIFKDMVSIYIANLQKSFQAMVDGWNTAFLPALKAIYEFIYSQFAPSLATLNTNVLEPMQGWFNSIGSAVTTLLSYLADLKKMFDSIKPPDWLEGQSPPPMADWFNWIAGGASALNVQLAGVNAGLAQPLGGGGTSITNTSSARSFTYAPSYSGVEAAPPQMDLALATSLAGV